MLATLRSPRLDLQRRLAALSAPLSMLLVALILLQAVPPAIPRPAEDKPPPIPALPATPAAPAYPLPPELIGRPELPELRTAHAAVFDMGEGRFALLQELDPLHYRDAGGAWQPINPAFAAVEGGWINRTNSLVTGLAERSPTAKLSAGEAGVAWEPLALLLAGPSGERELAVPLPERDAAPGLRSPDGARLSYPAGWSMPGLADQWQSGRGSSEYTLTLPTRPEAGGLAAPERLELRVRLSLLPGTRIELDGAPVALPVETSRPLVFVGPDGSRVDLAPPYAFEQGRPEEGVGGSYALAPTDTPEVVELRVRLPWAWLGAPERAYPVVIDPRFMVHTPGIYAQIRRTQDLITNKLSEPELISGSAARRRAGFWVSQSDYRARRDDLAFRFAIPPLPPSAQISSAYVTAIPSAVIIADGDKAGVTGDAFGANVSLHAINDDKWFLDFTLPSYNPQPIPVSGPNSYLYFNRLNDTDRGDNLPARQQGLTWDITSLAQFWVPQHDRPNPAPMFNSGLLLRLSAETCSMLSSLSPCRAFEFADNAALITANPDPRYNPAAADIDSSYRGSAPGQPVTFSSPFGGLRMLVFYNTPTIRPDQRYEVRPMGDLTVLGDNLPPGTRDSHYQAFHTYRVDGVSGQRWYALAARGYGPTKLEDMPENRLRATVPTSGSILLELGDPGAAETGNRPFTTNPGNDEVSYLLLDGRAMSQIQRQPRWLHLAKGQGDGAAGGPDIGRANGYELVMVDEVESISTQGGKENRFQKRKLRFGTDQPLALYDLDLPSGGTSLVTVRLAGSNIPADYGDFAQYLKAEVVFSNGANTPPLARSGGENLVLEGNRITRNSAPFIPGNRNAALVITYNGPNVFTNEKPPPAELIGDGAPSDGVVAGAEMAGASPDAPPGVPPILPELAFDLEIDVISCPAGSFPAGGNTCQAVQCPTSGMQAVSVGGLWLWSPSGWVSAGGNITRSDVTDPETDKAPMLGAVDSMLPGVAVIGGVVEYNPGATPPIQVKPIPGSASALGDIYLIDCAKQPLDTFAVYRGYMAHDIRGGGGQIPINIPVLEPAGTGARLSDPWREDDRPDLQNLEFLVYPSLNQAGGNAILNRRLFADNGQQTGLQYRVSWSFDVDGWLDIKHTITPQSGNAAPPRLAGMSITMGGATSLDMPPLPANPPPAYKSIPRQFHAVRASAATITQPADLGGASKPIQVLLLPRNVAPASNLAICPNGSCLDVRPLGDTFTNPNRFWEMPDVRTTGEAGTLQMSRDGELLVFSEDHPDAALQEFEHDFSFEAHKATVSVVRERCVNDPSQEGYDPNAKEVWVVRGETRIALPSIGGSGDPDSLIAAGFKLCAGTLRQVRLEFESPVGLPIGSTGLFLTGVRGSIDIFPTYTQIRVGVTFQAAQGGDGGVFTARGDVLIDTRGLFEFQGSAKVLGTVNANGKIWVAWAPLDVGFDVSVSVGGWLSGRAYAHLWRGQGWGDKYDWLPDDNAMHFAGFITAEIAIPAGAIIDVWEMRLPPSDVVLARIELAFGEFCLNSGCTEFEWGIKGKFALLGFDVGLYYGFEEGLDFILGNDDHILIDQYGGASATAGLLSGLASPELNVAPPPVPVNGVATRTIQIREEVDQILVGLSYLAGSPQLSLVGPNNLEITPANAEQHGAQFDLRPGATLVGLQNPQPGAWKLKISGLSPSGSERYTLLYFANRGAPGGSGAELAAAGDRLTVKPLSGGRQEIKWTVPGDAQAHHTISLYYRRTEVVSGTLHQDAPIQADLPYRDGSYIWDPAGVLDGAYQVFAVADDGRNALPANEISIPNDSCVAVSGPLPGARAFEKGRFPGTDIFTATTTVQLTDTTAPPTPTGLKLRADEGGIVASWNPASDADTGGYLLRWGPQSGGGFSEQGSLRLSRGDVTRHRIGGLRSGVTYGVTISAVDANGNTSSPSPALFSGAGAPGQPIPLTPTGLTRTGGDASSVGLSWTPAAGPQAAGYRLSYTRLDVTPLQAFALDAAGTTATISGLAAGATYDVRVTARNAGGWESAPSAPLRVVIGGSTDANGDGLPDAWANAHQVSGATADPDADGRSNAEELAAGSHPRRQDSDGDGKSDGEEQLAGSDPLRSDSHDGVFIHPRLSLGEHTLSFRVRPQAGAAGVAALPAPPAQSVAWSNVGGGTLQLKATSATPWLSASVVNNRVEVSVKPQGLAPGFHSGLVRLTQAGADPLVGEPQCIRVRTWIYPDGSAPAPVGTQLYIPFLQR